QAEDGIRARNVTGFRRVLFRSCHDFSSSVIILSLIRLRDHFRTLYYQNGRSSSLMSTGPSAFANGFSSALSCLDCCGAGLDPVTWLADALVSLSAEFVLSCCC